MATAKNLALLPPNGDNKTNQNHGRRRPARLQEETLSTDLLLVGSVPYDTAAEVFQNFGRPLGSHLKALPDGEVGPRAHWISRIHYQVFALHPDLEIVQRPALENGAARVAPRNAGDAWLFRVRDGVTKVRFGDPGWRLGYARDALNSYYVFKTMQEKGELRKGLRFQVSIASPNSAAPPRLFPKAGDCEIIREAYTDAVAAEVAMICAKIPHEDLAIQWDCSTEVQDVYGAAPPFTIDGALERNIGQMRILSPKIPEGVALGYHLCFGTLGGWPRFAPGDLSQTVELANGMIEASGRRVDWMHIPALDNLDDAFYAPLAKLKPRGAKIYLGMVHHMDTFEKRLAIARKYLPEFGLAAYCGLGRTPPSGLGDILREHEEAVRIAG
jgi:hypothetical protein